MTDFVKCLEDEIIQGTPGIPMEWARLTAMATFVPVLSKARIIDRISPLRLNFNSIMIGPPGTGKTLPMFNFTMPILKALGKQIMRDFIMPGRFSTESFINDWLNKGVGKGKKKTLVNNEGIIIRDEFSGMFNQIRHADWQSDGMEFISELYDGNPLKRSTRSGGNVLCDNYFANIITATTPIFVSKVDPMFFVQGTGNRFIYCYTDVTSLVVEELDPDDFFKEDWGTKRDCLITEYSEILVSLYKRLSKMSNLNIYVPEGGVWTKFKKECEEEWKKKAIADVTGWDYHPIKRYPELALKVAGIMEISKFASDIPTMSDGRINTFIIMEDTLKEAISMIKTSGKHFKEIVKLKSLLVTRTEPKSMEDEARAFMNPLRLVKDGLTAKEWYKRQDITATDEKMVKFKNICIEKGWVKMIPYSAIPQSLRVAKEVGTNGILYVVSDSV